MRRTKKPTPKPKNFVGSGIMLRELREARKLSQKEFGAKVGAHGQFISNTERGLNALTPEHISLMNVTDAYKYLRALLDDRISYQRAAHQQFCSQLGIQTQ